MGLPYTSGYTDDDSARRGLLDPGAPFLQKPLGPGQLALCGRELVEGALERA